MLPKRTGKSAHTCFLLIRIVYKIKLFLKCKVMEDKRINEMESLELISDMIRKTKSEASMKQDYNAFLFYGYFTMLVSVTVWLFTLFTGEREYAFIWFAMFIPYLWTNFIGKQKGVEVVTYLKSSLGSIWKVIGSMFGLTVIAIVAIGVIVGKIDFSLMMPLSIIYAGIGTSMTGLVIKEKWFVWLPLMGLLAAVYMLLTGKYDNSWNLLFGLSFLVFMVIPAHIVRSKIQES